MPGPRRGAEGASNHATVALLRSGLSAPSAPSLNVLVTSMWSAPWRRLHHAERESAAAAAAMRAGCSVPAQEPASKLTYG